jgi:hypothetical protein
VVLTSKLWFALALLALLNVLRWGSREVVVVDLFVATLLALLLVASWIWPDKVRFRRPTDDKLRPRR